MTLRFRIAIAAALLTILSFVVGLGVGFAMAPDGGAGGEGGGQPAAEPGCSHEEPVQRQV